MLQKSLVLQLLSTGCLYLIFGILLKRKRAIVVTRAMSRFAMIAVCAPYVMMGLNYVYLRAFGYETDPDGFLYIASLLLGVIFIIYILRVRAFIINTDESILRQSLEKLGSYTWEAYCPTSGIKRLQYMAGRKRCTWYLVHVDEWDCDLEVYVFSNGQVQVRPHGDPPTQGTWDDAMYALGDLMRECTLDSVMEHTPWIIGGGLLFLLLAAMHFWQYVSF